jgi:hypothetical protein
MRQSVQIRYDSDRLLPTIGRSCKLPKLIS